MALGARVRVTSRLLFRAGAAYEESPVSTANRTADIPVSDRVRGAVGVGWDMTDSLALDVSYMYARNIGDSVRQVGQDGSRLRADINRDLQGFGVQLTWRLR